jgi:hypothetical protein
MTCFSIQKYLRIAALFLAFLAIASPFARAQTEPPAEEIAKLKAEEQAMQEEEDGKVNSPIVLELFTGANCSACIFADRMLYDAQKDKQVIALSCRVKNTTSLSTSSSEANKEGSTEGPMDPCVFRQWTYSSNVANDVTLRIPIFYFNGKESAKADGGSQFGERLNRFHYKSANKIQEALLRWKDKDTISIHLPQQLGKGAKVNASVWLVRYKNMDVVRMDKGINAGRVLRFSNVIESITHVAKWHGNMRVVSADVTPPQGGKEKGGYVVLVGEMLGSEYLAAGKLEDYPVAADIQEEATKRAKARAAAEGKAIVVPSTKAPQQGGPIVP